ncbi:uncharacterized protein LOC131434170 [Malaya genurostris]|uniref:uncharacterized protein LOC131434170 n=1 Tax=Malaya genurostris TaxID=325434 RepID=UPI0026F40045|nr:uncharacterized protein LOC131434170 [Malaya genurostris]
MIVNTEAAQQSGIPALITSSPPASNVPDIAVSGPASASTPNSTDGKCFPCSAAEIVSHDLVPVGSDGYVSHAEITIDVPRRAPVSSSHRTRCSSFIETNILEQIGTDRVQRKITNSAPPSIVKFPTRSNCNQQSEIIASNNNMLGTSRALEYDYNAVIHSSSNSRPMIHDTLVVTSVSAVPPVTYRSLPVCSYNSIFPQNTFALNQELKPYAPAHSVAASRCVATNPTKSCLTGEHYRRMGGSTVNFQCPGLSVSSVHTGATLSTTCQTTWTRNKPPGPFGGDVPGMVNNYIPLSSQPNVMLTNSGGYRANTNVLIPPVSHVTSRPFDIPFLQPSVPSSISVPQIEQRQQQYIDRPAVPGRCGPTNEQMAARQVMPRELPSFSGDPQDWPIFYSSFCNSTDTCGFSDAENLARLQRCLKGQALDAVKSRLFMPQSVPFVIDTLRRLYGRPEILMYSLLQKLRTVPSPKTDNLQSQIDFGLAVQNVVDHMSIANLSDHLCNPMLLHELVEKLPPQLKMQWSYYKSRFTCVNLATFNAFMSELVLMASEVTLPMDALTLNSKSTKSGRDKPKLYIHAEEIRDGKSKAIEKNGVLPEQGIKACVFCDKTNHEIANCKQFKALDIDDRWKTVKQKQLCRSCLVPHRKWPCRTKTECGINGCRIHHHKLLHSENFSSKADLISVAGNKNTVVHQNLHRTMSFSLFRYLPVTIHGNGKQVHTYAFLDDGSNSTLLECNIASALGIKGPTDGFCLSWTGNITREEKESQRISVVIHGNGKKFKLHNVRTVQNLHLPAQTLDYEELSYTFPHLKGLPIQSYTNAVPGVIIGIEHIRLLTALRTREGNNNEPVATKTRLGWCIFGKSSQNSNVMEQLNVHIDDGMSNRDLHQWMKQFFAVEESSVTVKPEADEDKRARQIMETTTQRVNGAFETGLLWKYDHICFPDSYPMALRRMKALERRLSKEPALASRVMEQISEYEMKGYAHRITPEELQSTEASRVWYLPLGLVQNPKKPDKLRLIWDAKARVGGVSLNDMLLKGPDLLVELISVLLRFRQGEIAVVGDIKEMFHQISVRNEDKQSQRFVLRMQPELEPQIFVMDVCTFGATCSPSLAQFVKNKNAMEFAEIFPRAARAIRDNHYVDDFLDSVDTVEKAIRLVKEVKYIHGQAGFEIRNFSSNSDEVLTGIGETVERQQVSMNLDKLYTERVLGLIWIPKEDVFTFDLSNMKEEIKALVESESIPTKRQVLRTVMSLFDPMGLIAHFVVHGKVLMQQIWRSGTDWDDLISVDLRDGWRTWCRQMQKLNAVSVPRCFFKGVNSSMLKNVEAHLFVDASELACAAVLYLRFCSGGGPRCVLVAAKTKVSPLKPLSIPRLELQAAMIGTRLMDSVLKSLDIKITNRFMWTYSTTVLCWLRSDSRRYHQFVAFRVGEILTTTSVDEWHYVPSRMNIADAATKWKDGPNFDPNSPWFKGPEFLYQTPDHWPSEPSLNRAEAETELRSVFLYHGTIPYSLIDASRFSNWNRLLRTTAYVLRARRRFKGEKVIKPCIMSKEELFLAENLLWQQIQAESYPDEYAILRRSRENCTSPVSIPKSSALYRLSVFIDEYGVIRMNSRITEAPTVLYDTKFPIILPRKHVAVHLLAESYHRKFRHGNNETVCNEMRQRFFLPGLRVLIRKISKQCMACRVGKAIPVPPMMSSLPSARVTGLIRPFTHTGLDYFGPIQVRQGRSLVKRWVALFTCLTIRAVHLEIVHSLSTQSCIMAIRRFVARRGSPETFYSDNGTNFLGASNLLKKQIQDIHEDCAVTFTSARTSWIFNPPSAPHMGGSWERMVRSVKAAMLAIADHPHHPSDEVLETVTLEAESIVNSRPLTYIPLESSEQESLTPNHFLLYGTKGITQPELPVNNGKNVLRDCWRLAQSLVDHFWYRWIREYLPTITRRSKWFEPVQPLKVGDLVLVVEESKRNGWLRGRVVDVTKAPDGQVRRAVVQTKHGLLNRPAVKLALLDVLNPGDGPELHGQGNVTKPQG